MTTVTFQFLLGFYMGQVGAEAQCVEPLSIPFRILPVYPKPWGTHVLRFQFLLGFYLRISGAGGVSF